MTKPRLIILIRHAQSEGNKNREIHQSIPDHRVKLTSDGWTQAYDAGRRLRKLLRADDKVHFFTSPYRRTRETTEGILATLTSDEDEDGPSPFKRSGITVHEEPRLREQDFGNFQPCSAEMERMWQERADYGHFFYRIPNGESAADAYDRVSGFNESLWRQFGDEDFASVCVLVTHGLMSRVFLMKWYHFTVEYFEDLRNVNHCEFLIMRQQQETGKYLLENKLRTWSELRAERAALVAQEHAENPALYPAPVDQSKNIVPKRRWGGCPHGCNHKNHYKRLDDLEALRQRDEKAAAIAVGLEKDDQAPNKETKQHSPSPSISSLASRRPGGKFLPGYNSDDDPSSEEKSAGHKQPPARLTPSIDVTRAMEEVVSSPDGTPSFISAEDRLRSLRSPALHVGRDGGGTWSGHASANNSDVDDEHSDDDVHGHGGSRRMLRKGAPGEHNNVGSLAEQLQSLPSMSSSNSANDSNGANNGRVSALEPNAEPDKGHINGNGPILRSSGNGVITKEDIHLNSLGMAAGGARANKLGDYQSSDMSSEHDGDDELVKAEKEDRSIRGSVY